MVRFQSHLEQGSLHLHPFFHTASEPVERIANKEKMVDGQYVPVKFTPHQMRKLMLMAIGVIGRAPSRKLMDGLLRL